MANYLEEVSARFQRWERRTRGWQVHPQPVAPEPVFVPYKIPNPLKQPIIDDAKRQTVISSLIRALWRAPLPVASTPEDEEEPEPVSFERENLTEFPLLLRDTFHPKPQEYAPFLNSVAMASAPVAFELIGTPAHVTAQLAVSGADELHLKQQLRAIFPEVVCAPENGVLEAAWHAADASETLVVEFGLAQESMLPLANVQHDLCVPLIAALSELDEGEFGLFQVLFEHVKNPWAVSIVNALTTDSGDAFFINVPELLDGAKIKAARPLFGVVVRIAVRGPDHDRVQGIARNLASALTAFAQSGGNELIPLHNDDYPPVVHFEDVLRRQSHRSGMLLNADELLGFIRFPSSAVQSPKFLRQKQKTKLAPNDTTAGKGILLGTNHHAGETREVRLTTDQRIRHTHIIGASGTGKSTLLFNLIRQDIEAGQGVGVIDPHGDLIDKILGIIPERRIKDVVLLNPSDEEFIVGFNILSAHSETEKNLLASDLVSVFRRLSTSWGDQMGSVLSNAVRAFLESSRGGTLADMQRFFLETAYREQFLATVNDPGVVYYWRKSFPQLTGNKSIGPILTRLDTFLGPKLIRYMVSQSQNKLNFGSIMDSGKIFLARLSQGEIGKENSYLLGSLLVTKFHQLAMSRQRLSESQRRNFWLYLDEFHNFITSSMAEILTGARKYHLGLTLAHHELHQLQRDPEVASAVLSTPCTRVCFRVGDQDARALESSFSSFEAHDLQNLNTGDAVCRIERSDCDFNLSVALPDYPDAATTAMRRQEVIASSHEKYATPRAEVEAVLSASLPSAAMAAPTTATEPKLPKPAKPAVPAVSTDTTPSFATALPSPVEPQSQLVREKKVVLPPADLGRGGKQHQAIQLRIKEAAEAVGFRAIIEKSILDGAGQVDLALERDGTAWACEITITTTIDHEVGNVSKCLKAGFDQIAVIGVSEDKLAKIKGAVANSLGPEVAMRVGYFLPDAFISSLKDAPKLEKSPVTSVKIRRGYTVNTTYAELSPEETKARENAMIKFIAESMKEAKRSKPKNP